jgi:neutral trehalase
MPPETEPTHFDAVMRAYAQRHNMAATAFTAAYRARQVADPELDAYFAHDRSLREVPRRPEQRTQRLSVCVCVSMSGCV